MALACAVTDVCGARCRFDSAIFSSASTASNCPVACKVNLSMFNPHKLLKFAPTTERALNGFAKTLAEADYTVAVRWSKGREIEAACGQLAAHAFYRKAE